MLDSNTLTKGITIANIEIKLTQFANDTTIFWMAQNTLEIFGSLSGLKKEHVKNKNAMDRVEKTVQ